MLATLLRRHRDEIAAAWTERVCALRGSRYAACDPRNVLQWSLEAIDAIVRTREAGSGELDMHARTMALAREAQGFEVDEVIDGLLLLQECVLPHLSAAAGSPAAAVEVVRELNADIRLMVAAFARLFAESTRRSAERVAVLEERHRLARDLHDSVSQSLYGVGMCAEAAARLLEAGQTEAAASCLRDVCTSATGALREMRSLIFDLRPSILQDEGLVAALRARLAGVESRSGLRAELTSEGVGRLPAAVEEALYGIAREALNNCLKHGHATRIEVRLRRADDTLELEVADNGVGFDVASAQGGGGLGLRGMRERAEGIEGVLHVTSCPDRGTRVRVRAPLAPRVPGLAGGGNRW